MDIQDISEKITPTLKSHGIKKAALFGSRSRQTATHNSDIDILVELGKKMSLLDFVGLKLELEESLGKKVDLVQYKTIKPSLKNYILKDERIFFTA
jgi:hypothetical protein